MNNILIECSQVQSNTINSNNGDFETILPHPLILEEGDNFLLSKCFIDNEIESEGIIDIPYDLNLVVSCAVYIQNEDATKFDSAQDENDTGLDNGSYFLYDIITDTPPAGGTSKMEFITKIRFVWGHDNESDEYFGDRTGGDKPVKFIGHDIHKNPFPVFVNIPQTPTEDEMVDVEVNIYVLKIEIGSGYYAHDGSLTLDNSDGNWTFNRILPTYVTPFVIVDSNQHELAGKASCSLKTFDKLMVLPKAKYQPEDMIQIINDKLNHNVFPQPVLTGASNIISNPFLHISSEFAFGKNNNEFLLFPDLKSYSALPDSKGGSKGLTNNEPTKNYFIGTNTIELAYSSDLNKFYWNFLHFPIYSTQNGNPIVTRVVPLTSGATPADQKYIQQGKNGGVVFNDLRATYTDPITRQELPFDFWSKKLGFQLDKLIPKKVVKTFQPGTTTYTANILDVTDGFQMTNAGFILDSSIDKADYQKIDTTKLNEVNSDFNDVVYASNKVLGNGVLDSAYYLVEIQLNFSSNIVGTNSITRNISGIINRYYSKGSFVSSGGDPSFIINYKGEPIIIQSMRIRILNPDRTLALIGSNNTLFFEIIKGNNNID